ncbi:MAG: hypothetical protein WA058_03560 [Minisyncoccia bacterium]
MRYPITKLVAGLIGTEAVVVMFGWIFNIEWLTRIIPTGNNMKFITAVLFLLGAAGLYAMALAIEEENEMARVLLPGISLMIFLITTTLLVGRILNTATGVEELFLTSIGPVNLTGEVSRTGWPALPTLIDFILFALLGIVALFASAFREKIIRYGGYFIIFTGLLAVIGYLLNLPDLYYSFSLSGVPLAFNTALCFILLGFGLTRITKPGGNQ